ncbi:phage virion morphogenesis protein [Aggregatibacter actinomycetemcomitans]|uniref:phage virion morphogenesis protein n=1 Tax=Aggregatibacter actinomycetemcomitans TaxID=714 RepID=UPI00197B21D4|nr:phage virion morphogenesis protein [Aggregatibacter actinomycetemcomitans]MBN6067871.1 phage virion morphogenesis protein [Aggregatibacter actinomycetemcomitans]MBN6085808.1 phage virion morphogenesis protein [Aggregatibacter actinomycetemcomitans]
MTIALKPKSDSVARVKRTLMYLRLTPQQRQKVMQKVLWRLKDNAKKNVSAQRDPDGKAWKPRKRQEKSARKNKMLKFRAKYLNSKIESQGDLGRLHYNDQKGAEIGAVHQKGLTVEVKQTAKEKAALEKLLAQNKQPATAKQAKRLKELGYTEATAKRGKNGKLKRKKATAKNIRATMSQGQAGLIIRLLEKKQGINTRRGLKSYKMTARPFLDENEQRNAEIVSKELLKAFESGIRQ